MSKYDIPPQFEYQNRIINVTSCHGEGKKHLELQNGFFKKITDFPRVVPHFFFRNLTCLVTIRYSDQFRMSKYDIWPDFDIQNSIFECQNTTIGPI